MKVRFSGPEPETRVSGKKHKAAKGKTSRVSSLAAIMETLYAVSVVCLITALARGKVPGPLPLDLIVPRRTEGVKGKASPPTQAAVRLIPTIGRGSSDTTGRRP
jgi:hypothetical protein